MTWFKNCIQLPFKIKKQKKSKFVLIKEKILTHTLFATRLPFTKNILQRVTHGEATQMIALV